MTRSMDMSGTDELLPADDSSHVLARKGSRNKLRVPKRRWRCRAALAAALFAFSVPSVQAYLVYDTAVVAFDNSTSVTDSEGGTSISNDNASLGSSSLEQFDPALGVLTGVEIVLESTRSQTVTVASTQGGGTGTTGVNSTGSGSSTARIIAPGVEYTFSSAISADGTCRGNSKNACSHVTKGGSETTNQNIQVAGSLDGYVDTGTGTVTVERTAPTLSASQLGDVFTGTETTTYDLNWAGNLSASYTYLLHAAPSFDGNTSQNLLTLDFGTVSQNSTVGSLGFSIFNLADPDRTDLDLIGISASGATGVLGSDLSLFQNLVQGEDLLFYATLDTSTSGDFLATYVLTFSDAANIGAANSHSTYTLTLTLKGTVAAVPVPDSVWLLGSGLIGVIGVARRKPH